MEFLSDRLYVQLAKRAGFPTLEDLKRVRDLQREWLDAGTPATLFMVSQIEGLIDAEQTRQFEEWARHVVSSASGRIEVVHSPTVEVKVEHAFLRPPCEPEPEPTLEVPDELLSSGSADALEIDVESGELELLPDSAEIDLQTLGRFEAAPERVLGEDDLEIVDEDEVSELIEVEAAWSPVDSEAGVFSASEHTELFAEDDELVSDEGDPLADVLAALDEQSGRQRRQSSPSREALLGGLLDVCDDSDEPPVPFRAGARGDSDTGEIDLDSWRSDAPTDPRTRAAVGYSEDEVLRLIEESEKATRSDDDSSCEDGLRSRAKKRRTQQPSPRSRTGRVGLTRTRSSVSRRWT